MPICGPAFGKWKFTAPSAQTEGVIRIPRGMAIESVAISEGCLLVRATESVPGAMSRAARAVIDSADATGGNLTVVDRGAVLELERLVEEEENQNMTICRPSIGRDAA
jgi:hypothetical protein